MAMEDAYSLAACLQIGGKKDVPIATKVHNHLRYVIANRTVSGSGSFWWEQI